MGSNDRVQKRKNSALIYFARYSEGEMEKYSKYFIQQIKQFVDNVYIVSKKEIKDIEFRVLAKSDSNKTLSAYYAGISQIDFQEIKQYHRIFCVSDAIMGPVFDINEMIEEMIERRVDCWSITKQHPTPLNFLDYTGENLQEEYLHPEFLVFEKALLQADNFMDMLKEAARQEDLRDSWIDNQALVFSKRLTENNFRVSTYTDTADIYKMYYNPLLFCPVKMIREKKCPVFLRDSFGGNYADQISNTIGNMSLELLEYLKEKTSYDIEMIWDTILKYDNQQDIYNNLHLNYILPLKTSDKGKIQKILNEKKIALVMHLYFVDLLPLSYHYAQAFPAEGDIYITTNSEEKRKEIQKVFKSIICNKLEIRVIENRGRDVSSLLTGVKDVVMDYDYVCFVHDKKSAQIVPGSIGHDFGYQCLENTLGSQDFVNNVICTLYENKRLGLLSPIYPIHGSYFAVHGSIDWGGNYQNTKELASKLGISVPIEENKSPVAPLGTMFWFKSPALKCLYAQDWEYEDFPQEPNGVDGTLLHAIERLYAFAAQQEGYYPAIVCNDQFAKFSLTNQGVFLQGLNRSLEKYAGYLSFQQATNQIESMIYEVNLLRELVTALKNQKEQTETNVIALAVEIKIFLKNMWKRWIGKFDKRKQ